MLASFGLSTVDIFALIFFFASWIGHFWLLNYSPLRHKTITAYMNLERNRWMQNMIVRDPKMTDVLIQNGFQHGVLFFASTSMLIVGALLAGLGATDKAIDVLIGLPYSTTTTRSVWELKVLLVLFIFVFSFFKFAWSHRQFNYVLIMLGAVPPATELTDKTRAQAARISELHALAAQHFTTGLNAYFFALAAFAWFLNAWVFIAATVWVSLVLYRRAFASRFAKLLRDFAKHTE